MFLVNSRYPLVCAPYLRLPVNKALLSRSYESNLPSSFNIVLSNALVFSTYPPVSVWGTVYMLELFPGTSLMHFQSNKKIHIQTFVTSSRPSNIKLVPISYGFRPRLRGRLTLRGITLRRNPWIYGDSVSRTINRYSCQNSRFRYLHHALQHNFNGLRNAPLPHSKECPQFRCMALAPIHLRCGKT